jgi:predicted DNA-binding transcriptional regulator YafY
LRRADRLFRIVQALRPDRWLTAQALADDLGVSERTIYRDIQDLSLSGIPVLAETGRGYRLMAGFHLPPLMFDEAELEALLLGMRMVSVWTDPSLAKAAQGVSTKIEAVLPERLQPELARMDLLVPPFGPEAEVAEALTLLRAAIRAHTKVSFHYCRADGTTSTRTAHPLGLAYWGRSWTLIAWCELRRDFRQFRLDRMSHWVDLAEPYEAAPGRTLDDFLAQVSDQREP